MTNFNGPTALIAFYLLITGNLCGSAQVITTEDNPLPRNYVIRVKQLSEFIGRFNYEKDFLNQDIGPSFSAKITRPQYIGLLFDRETDARQAGKSKDMPDDSLIGNFVQEVCSDSLFIDKYSEFIYAELKCRVTIHNKSNYILLLVKQEFDHGLKWCMVSVYADYDIGKNPTENSSLNNMQSNDNEQLDYIPPLSNETNFIVLKNLLTQNRNLGIYTARIHNPQRIHDFYQAVSSGELKFQYVETMTYHLFDIPGWRMVLNNFQRDTENSGWLISELERTTENGKHYIREKYGIDPDRR